MVRGRGASNTPGSTREFRNPVTSSGKDGTWFSDESCEFEQV